MAAWPAVALVGSYELLMMVIRSSQVPGDCVPETDRDADPLRGRAAELLAGLVRAARGRPGSLGARDPRSTPRRPAPGTSAAGLPRSGSCKAGGKFRCVTDLPGEGVKSTAEARGANCNAQAIRLMAGSLIVEVVGSSAAAGVLLSGRHAP